MSELVEYLERWAHVGLAFGLGVLAGVVALGEMVRRADWTKGVR